MKSIRLLIFFFLLGTIAACDQDRKTDDPEILKKIHSDYFFEGIKNKDLNKLNSLTTNDFIVFEDGKIWNNDSIFKMANSFTSIQGTWTFDYKRIAIDESSGYIIYINHGDLLLNDTIKMQLEWLESATFKKIDGNWKLDFIHSTVKE